MTGPLLLKPYEPFIVRPNRKGFQVETMEGKILFSLDIPYSEVKFVMIPAPDGNLLEVEMAWIEE